MQDLTQHEARILVLTLLIQLLERQDFTSSVLSKQGNDELFKAKQRQLEILTSNLTFAQKQAR